LSGMRVPRLVSDVPVFERWWVHPFRLAPGASFRLAPGARRASDRHAHHSHVHRAAI